MPPSGAAHATEQATLACINVQLAEQPLHPPAAEVARDNGKVAPDATKHHGQGLSKQKESLQHLLMLEGGSGGLQTSTASVGCFSSQSTVTACAKPAGRSNSAQRLCEDCQT
eukprot:CAMPEP_0194763762 /NCGR_PEP_ID=MMETSP0323_2-20130528/20485_1 /TAXON_ID=2866 ORGANISM="Crypthecodinium cohnii, Strain Seligo" /NCGR_SAMPLE_ID=MMETSP0323_2 /ASSEMBLY_ACC=CAM_ASM_000346 /LENGTH=111 /DNA_ID=CAMNT_0039689389 /DNA_START=170 /DNA_END=502 /DNA_ORIENTATION=+